MTNIDYKSKNFLIKNLHLYLHQNLKKNELNYFFLDKTNTFLFNINFFTYTKKVLTFSRKYSKYSIRYIRRLNGFPNRGQRTSSNAKTAKKRLGLNQF